HSLWVVRETQHLTPYGSFEKLNISLPMGRSRNSTSHSLWVVRETQHLTPYGSFDGSRFSFHIRIVFVLLYETALYDRYLGSQFYRDQ
ncbi:hypothetical protein, partial [Leptospira interrogans]